MYGFSFDSTHSSTFDAFITELSNPFIAKPRDQYESIPGSNKSILFNEGLEDKIITFNLVVKHDLQTRTEKLRNVTRWLFKEDKRNIIFDYYQDIYYVGKISDVLEGEVKPNYSVLHISFTVQPFAYSLTTNEIVTTNNATISIVNNGTFTCIPVFTVHATSTITQMVFTYYDRQLFFNGTLEAGETMVLDLEEIEFYKLDEEQTNMADEVAGYFFELPIGTNNIFVKVTGGCSITTNWKERFL